MASVFLFVFFVLSHLLLLLSASKCPPFPCGRLGLIAFPFANETNPECGVLTVNCRDPNPKFQLEVGGGYEVQRIYYEDNTILVADTEFWNHLPPNSCENLTNLTFPSSSFVSSEIAQPIQTLFKCKRSTLDIPPPSNFTKKSCNDDDYNIYYSNSNHSVPGSLSGCSIIQLPKNSSPWPDEDELFALLTAEFKLRVRVSDECPLCYNGGQCKPGEKEKIYCHEECFKCFNAGGQCKPDDKGKLYCDYECFKCHKRGGQCKWDGKGKLSCVDGKGNDLARNNTTIFGETRIHS